MYEPEEYKGMGEPKGKGSSGSFTPGIMEYISSAGDTDRVNGEYRYKNGYTQKIYSDAHYVHEDESTVPPRYYTPPEKNPWENRGGKNGDAKKSGGWLKTACLCLACALIGGYLAADITRNNFESRIAQVESQLESLESQEQAADSDVMSLDPNGQQVLPSQIYSNACQQVVGITTDVTYTNIFGMKTSSPVSGSGFIVTENGYIITNYHVIEYAYQGNYDISVMLHDGSTYEAAIVGVEEGSDIAVLKIEAYGLQPVSFGNSDELNVGDEIYAVGNPLGVLEFSMSTGHVSALNRMVNTHENMDGISMFQIDAAVNEGNSGGPAYNSMGQVVGVITAKYSDTDIEGIGFAIPINDAAAIANDLITKGYVTGKAYMGISFDDRYNEMYSRYYGMPVGAYVASVEEGSCAETAGVQAGDIITQLGDQAIKSYTDVRQALKQYSAGDSVQLDLYRAGESMALTITFDEAVPQTSETELSRTDDAGSLAG